MLLWKKHLIIKERKRLEAAIHSYEACEVFKCLAYWGCSCPDANAIYGDIAVKIANRQGFKIEGNLLAECQYVFRWDIAHTKLIPYRISIHPKTAANIAKGGRRFGSMSIMAEIVGE